jgi:C1A family cysteine protease
MSVGDCLIGLDSTGQTKEVDWPYHAQKCLSTTAKFFTRKGHSAGFDSNAAEALLKVGNPSVVILDIGLEFFMKMDDTPLEASDALPVQGCHAVAISGFRRIGNRRQFRLKNSWGAGWGSNGQVWASAEYLELRSSGLIRLV